MPLHVTVLGYSGCPFFEKAACIASKLGQNKTSNDVQYSVQNIPQPEWKKQLSNTLAQLPREGFSEHRTCPLVYANVCSQRQAEHNGERLDPKCIRYIGGFAEFLNMLTTGKLDGYTHNPADLVRNC